VARGVTIGPGVPSSYCIELNAHALARYAVTCQEAGVVPIVEPEVLMDGDHSIARCFAVTEATLHALFVALHHQGAVLEGLLLKPNMVLPGTDCPVESTVEDVAQATLRCLRRTVPAAVPGVVFLSGGQDEVRATAHLNALNVLDGSPPWALSFSYARALQAPAMRTWGGRKENVAAAQAALEHRARCNSAACAGRYTADLEHAAAASARQGRP
jgi:fructose-bisphosphate aldolase class I